MSEQPKLKEMSLKDLYNDTLFIPNYQRPYKWRKEHVIQLLNDLHENIYLKKEVIYRVGSIIIHQDKNNTLNVVDGQQRLTTLSLILFCLDDKFDKILINEIYHNEISKNNIKFNYNIIEEWFTSKNIDKISYKSKIETFCQFVMITVFKQDEAFQLFDSQNSRGKALYPHDLLKAFHLREMNKNGNSQELMEKYSRTWENYLVQDGKPLLSIMNNYLFRIRKWSKGEHKYFFSKMEINEFKGISLHKRVKYNFELSLRLLEGTIENSQKDNLFKNFSIAQTFPFQINMPIINGKNFFDYIFYYIELNEKLLKDDKSDFVKFNRNRFNYWGIHRVGDQKVKNLYENICLLFVDRFGLENFENVYYQEFFKNAFQIRLDSKSISERSILNHQKALKFFNLIPNCYQPEDLQSNLFCNYPKKDWIPQNYINRIDEIFEFLTDTKIKKNEQ